MPVLARKTAELVAGRLHYARHARALVWHARAVHQILIVLYAISGKIRYDKRRRRAGRARLTRPGDATVRRAHGSVAEGRARARTTAGREGADDAVAARLTAGDDDGVRATCDEASDNDRDAATSGGSVATTGGGDAGDGGGDGGGGGQRPAK
jgi:uncharacterized membrane protein YgcG